MTLGSACRLGLVALAAAAAPALAAQSVRGTVVDAETRAPLAGAAVRLIGPDSVVVSATLTSDAGEFLVTGPRGDHELVVERLGYATDHQTVRLRPSGFIDLVVPLQTRPIRLDSLVVSAEPRPLPLVNGGFYDRKKLGIGSFLERSEFTKYEPRNVGDIIRRVPGANVTKQRDFSDVIMHGTFIEKRANCLPLIYLNGMRVTANYNWVANWGDARFNLDDMPADQVQAIEVYTSKASSPVQFLKADSECGVVLIWTRSAR